MKTTSRLLTLDVWLSECLADNHLVVLDELIRQRFTVVKDTEHKFDPQGLTRVYILSESHCVIHTYPEHNYFSLDLFICNPAVDLACISDTLSELLPVRSMKKAVQHRG